jgi:hypothetical protein
MTPAIRSRARTAAERTRPRAPSRKRGRGTSLTPAIGATARQDSRRRDASVPGAGVRSDEHRGIARRARISKRTFYHRFDDKPMLFGAVVHRIIDRLRPPADVPLLDGADLRKSCNGWRRSSCAAPYRCRPSHSTG